MGRREAATLGEQRDVLEGCAASVMACARASSGARQMSLARLALELLDEARPGPLAAVQR